MGRVHTSTPDASDLDANQLILPSPEVKGNGAITYLPAIDRTVFAWWGSPWDSRPKVNSAILDHGRLNLATLWQHFAQQFPPIHAALTAYYSEHGRPRVVAAPPDLV